MDEKNKKEKHINDLNNLYNCYFSFFQALQKSCFLTNAEWIFYLWSIFFSFCSTLMLCLSEEICISILSYLFLILIFILDVILSRKNRKHSKEECFNSFYEITQGFNSNMESYVRNIKKLKTIVEAKEFSKISENIKTVPILTIISAVLAIPSALDFFISNDKPKPFSVVIKIAIEFFNQKYLIFVTILLFVLFISIIVKYLKRASYQRQLFADCINYISKLLEIEQ